MSRTIKYAHRYTREKTREKYTVSHGMQTREDKAAIVREKRALKRKTKQLTKKLLKQQLNYYLDEENSNLIVTSI